MASDRERFEKEIGRLGWIMTRCGEHYLTVVVETAWIGWQAGRSDALEEAQRKVVSEIQSSTGPTGGWLDSPLAICAAIVSALKADTPKERQ